MISVGMNKNQQILFLSHGGGPLPLLGDPSHSAMVRCLKNLAASVQKPSAILVVSAHWEESMPTVTSGPNPSLIYDYYGFPEESYHIAYPCQGEPLLAESVQEQLALAGIRSQLDDKRGFDHGLFVPLKILFPEADIPCIQLSLVNNLDPVLHVRIGEALRALDFENLMVIGSGFSFHNLRAFFSPETEDAKLMNASFEAWLKETCSNPALSEETRMQRLFEWEKAPGARYCHPREEHLLPLHVCSGLAGRACNQVFELQILEKQSSMFFWSEGP